MLDLIVKGGLLVDGTGAPRRHADLGIADGCIVEIAGPGRIDEPAAERLDASDLVVAPGFVDPHTHYDAQWCWDPMITPSSWHGVTTAIAGNCGVGVAPCRADMRDVATWDLVNVESIPHDALAEGIHWKWEDFGEFLDAADRTGLGIDLGFLVPLSPLRHFVMGHASMERAANEDETATLAETLRRAMAAGALGFSTSGQPQHIGYQGRPLASRLASRDELRVCANILRDLGRGAIEIALCSSTSIPDDEELGLLEMLLDESQRPVTWIALLERADQPDACQDTLARTEGLIRRGGIPQTSARPVVGYVDLRTPFAFANHGCWQPAFNQPLERQIELYRNRDFRDAFRKDLERPRIFNGDWSTMKVAEVVDPKLSSALGRTIAEVAAERACDPLDAFLDVAIEDGLETRFSCVMFNADDERVGRLVADERVMIGLADGGAHVDALCDSGYATYTLGKWVRERAVLDLERAIQRLSAEPARFFGLDDRGTLEVGKRADLVVFDAERIGSDKDPEMRRDLPGGGRRPVIEPEGVEATLVRGRIVHRGGRETGERPGGVARPTSSPR